MCLVLKSCQLMVLSLRLGTIIFPVFTNFSHLTSEFESYSVMISYCIYQALHKMREYERLHAEGKLRQLNTFASHGSKDDSKGASNKQVKDDVTTSSAGDMGSDSSFSDVQVCTLPYIQC